MIYTVEPGDYLTKIAREHGFGNWRTIYDDPKNAEFRAKRPNPDLIYPGDQLFIPEREAKKTVQVDTTRKHVFRLASSGITLHLCLRDDLDEPLAILKYELSTDFQTIVRGGSGGSTSPDFDESNMSKGIVLEKLSRPVAQARLKVWSEDESAPDPDIDMNLEVGHLDPIEEMKGVQGRLNNLGFGCGLVDGKYGPKTKTALMLFQEAYGLPETGKADDTTRAKLSEVYGC